jgi:hypothetical protein
MQKRFIGAMLFLILLICSNQVYAWNYPRDGKFKQLHPHQDSWYFVDYEHWDIKAPDKWQHFTGCYLSQKFLSAHLDKYLSASIVMGISILKEYEDAYREGWSLRDIFADFLGVFAGIHSNRNYKLLCLYDNQKITLNLSLNIDF